MSAPSTQFQQFLAGLEARISGLEGRQSALAELSGEPRSDIGPIQSYLQDVYNLAPEVVRTEHLKWELRISAGAIVFTTPSRKIDPEFSFDLRRLRIVGWSSDPTDINFANPTITFNVEDQGRGRGGVFRDPISITETANHRGEVNSELVWDAFYVFVPGADVGGIWGVDLTTLNPANNYTFQAVITGDVLRMRTLPGGAMISQQNGRRR